MNRITVYAAGALALASGITASAQRAELLNPTLTAGGRATPAWLVLGEPIVGGVGTFIAGAVPAFAGAAPPPASAPPRVIFSNNLLDGPTSDVPGIPGARFAGFERPYASPSGERWIITARTTLAGPENEVILVGAEFAGAVAVREGTTFLTGSSELCGPIDPYVAIADDGSFAFTTNTDADTAADEIAVRYDAGLGQFGVAAREGAALPGATGQTYGPTIDSVQLVRSPLSGAFELWLRAADTGGPLPPASDDFFLNADTGQVVLQQGLIPTNQPGGATYALQVFDPGSPRLSGREQNWLVVGRLDTGSTANNDVVLFNGAVVTQEGYPIPSAPALGTVAQNGILSALSTPSVDWVVAGSFIDDTDFVTWQRSGGLVRDSVLTDEPVGAGTGEYFDDTLFERTFFLITANHRGALVIGANTDNPDPARDSVLLLIRGGSRRILAREGDPVDVDGDGIANDDAVINEFRPNVAFLRDDLVLTNTGRLLFIARLVTTGGTPLGEAVLSLQAYKPADGDLDGDGSVSFADAAALLDCLSGPVTPGLPGSGCDPSVLEAFDYEDDTDLDMADLAFFQSVFGS